MELHEQLCKKLREENDAFIKKLNEGTVQNAIDNAYGVVFKEDLILSIESADVLTDEQITALLALENTLETMYSEWLDTDDGIGELLLASIVSLADIELKGES